MDPKPAPIFHPRSEHAGGPDALADNSHPHDWSGHTSVHPASTVSFAAPAPNPEHDGIAKFHQVEVVHSEWAGGHAYAEGSNPYAAWYAPHGSSEAFSTVSEALAAKAKLQAGMSGAKSTSQMPPPSAGSSGLTQQPAL